MTRTMRLAAVALLLPAALAAQEETRRIPRLTEGTVIRLTAGGAREIGTFLRVDGGSLVLSGAGVDRRFPETRVDSLWRQVSRAKRGAVIGGVIGGVATSAFFLWLVDTFCETDAASCNRDMVKAGLFGVGIGGAGGALIGAGIGAIVKGWERVVP